MTLDGNEQEGIEYQYLYRKINPFQVEHQREQHHQTAAIERENI